MTSSSVTGASAMLTAPTPSATIGSTAGRLLRSRYDAASSTRRHHGRQWLPRMAATPSPRALTWGSTVTTSAATNSAISSVAHDVGSTTTTETAHPAVRRASTRCGTSCSAGKDPPVTTRTWSAALANGSAGERAERRPASTIQTGPPGSRRSPAITAASVPAACTSAE